MERFAGQHLAVVGATCAIGAALARLIVAEGGRVTLVGRSPDKLAALAQALGPLAATACCDLADERARAALPQAVAAGHGPVNGLVYVAGYHRLMPLGAGHASSLAEHLVLNLQAPLDLVRLFSSRRASDASQARSFTMIASVAHRIGEPALSAYSASKAAMVGAARALAVELAPKNIRVNTVSPGWVSGDTADTVAAAIPAASLASIAAAYPLGLGTADDVAQAAAFLASPAARWITGTDLVVDGGRTCV